LDDFASALSSPNTNDVMAKLAAKNREKKYKQEASKALTDLCDNISDPKQPDHILAKLAEKKAERERAEAMRLAEEAIYAAKPLPEMEEKEKEKEKEMHSKKGTLEEVLLSPRKRREQKTKEKEEAEKKEFGETLANPNSIRTLQKLHAKNLERIKKEKDKEEVASTLASTDSSSVLEKSAQKKEREATQGSTSQDTSEESELTRHKKLVSLPLSIPKRTSTQAEKEDAAVGSTGVNKTIAPSPKRRTSHHFAMPSFSPSSKRGSTPRESKKRTLLDSPAPSRPSSLPPTAIPTRIGTENDMSSRSSKGSMTSTEETTHSDAREKRLQDTNTDTDTDTDTDTGRDRDRDRDKDRDRNRDRDRDIDRDRSATALFDSGEGRFDDDEDKSSDQDRSMPTLPSIPTTPPRNLSNHRQHGSTSHIPGSPSRTRDRAHKHGRNHTYVTSPLPCACSCQPTDGTATVSPGPVHRPGPCPVCTGPATDPLPKSMSTLLIELPGGGYKGSH
jgi:hypothetical protein